MNTFNDIEYTAGPPGSSYGEPRVHLMGQTLNVFMGKPREEMTYIDLVAEMRWYAVIDETLAALGLDDAAQHVAKRFIGAKLFEVECRIRGFPVVGEMSLDQVQMFLNYVRNVLGILMIQNGATGEIFNAISALYISFLTEREKELMCDIICTCTRSETGYLKPVVEMIDSGIHVFFNTPRQDMTRENLLEEMEWFSTIDETLSTLGVDRLARVKSFLGRKIFDVECRLGNLPVLEKMTPRQRCTCLAWVKNVLPDDLTQNGATPATSHAICELYTSLLTAHRN